MSVGVINKKKPYTELFWNFRAATKKKQSNGGIDVRTLQIAKAISAHTSTKLVLVLMLCISTPLIGSTARATDKNKRSKSKAAETKKSKATDKKSKSKTAERNAKNSRSNNKREDSRLARNSKNKKEDKRSNAKNSKNDKRTVAAKRNEKNTKNSRNSRKEVVKAEPKKDLRKLSRKERAAELRRRRAEEIARRRAAEEARRRAIEEARRREAEFLQRLKDEATTNILNDDISGEDPEARRAAISALGDKVGTVVVMNPKTGQVYSVVNQEWGLRKGFKPCSTIKLLTGMAGINEGEIKPEEEAYYSPNRLNLVDALAFSKNPYFQSVGGRVGFEKMKSYAKDLGLGEKTGINLPESPGTIPQEKSGYAVNHMSSHGDDFEITPIQLATMVSAIGNGGKLLTPRVLKSEAEKIRFAPKVRHTLNVPQKTLDDLLPGMVGAVNFGTAKGAQTPGYFIAGKTGSCTGQGTKLGLFASYGPVGDPQLAVVVITRGPGQKGKIAAGVAGQVYRALSYRFTKPQNVPIARIPTMPRQRAVKPTDTEEDDDTETTAADTTTQQQTDVNGKSATDSKVQTINKTYQKNPPSTQQQKTTQPIIIRPKDFPLSNPTKTSPVQINPAGKPQVKQNAFPDGQRPRIVNP